MWCKSTSTAEFQFLSQLHYLLKSVFCFNSTATMRISIFVLCSLATGVFTNPTPQPATTEELNSITQLIQKGGPVPEGVRITEDPNMSPSTTHAGNLFKRASYCGAKCDGRCCCTICDGWRCVIVCGVLVGCANQELC